MAQYIPKDALVAEIERLKKTEGWCQVGGDTADVYYARGFRFACERIISFIDSLEVKEVDLEKEIEKEIGYNYNPVDGLSFEEFRRIAKYFAEFGIKAQKGEEV